MSGKICPLTPSQQPTNVEHLVVNDVPLSSNLNLHNVNSVANAEKSRTARNVTRPQECNQITTLNPGTQQNPTELLPKVDADIDSSGYCGIM